MQDGLELRWYFSLIRRWLWLIVVCTLLGATSAFLVCSRMTPVYSGSATLLIQVAPTSGMSDYDAVLTSERLAGTYSQMLSGRPVLEAVIARLGLDETPDTLAKRVKVELVRDTQLIRLSVEDTDPTRAALIANTIAEVFIAQNEALQAERYADSLASTQEQIVESSALVEETQAEIDTLSTLRQEQAELARLETILAGYRSTYATLQQNYEQMRLAAAQATDSVIVIETAQVPERPVRSRYSASATLLVRQALASGTSDYDAVLTSERLARTYSQMLGGRPVLEAAITLLGLEETPDALAERVKAELVPDTQLIQLSVEDTDPTRAALIANTITEVFITQNEVLQQEQYTEFLASMQEQIVESLALMEETQAEIDALHTRTIQEQTELARLETVLAGYRNTYATLQQNYEQIRLTAAQSTDNVILVETAWVPKKPVRPRTLVNTALAAVVGAMLALGVAFLLEYLDDTIKTPDDVSGALGLTTLGAIGRLAKGEEELVVAAQPLSPVAEAFRALCTNVRFSSINGPLRTLLVTSPGLAEGKSITAANLAVAMAQAGLSVVAVDADLRCPRLGQLLGLDPREGVTAERLWWGLSGSLLEGRTDGRLHPVQVEGLRVLPSGELPPNPAELMGSQHMQQLLHELAQQVDVVLIDSPPVLPVADATALAQAVDGVLLVLEAGQTRRKAARQAVGSLRQVGANLVGVVLNGVSTHKGYYHYSYHETYGDGSGRRKRRRRRLFGRRRKAD